MKITKMIVLLGCIGTVHPFKSHKHVYLLENSGVSHKNRIVLKNILQALDDSSTYQHLVAASKASSFLQESIDKKIRVYVSAYQEDQGPLGFAIEIVCLQKQHLDDFARIAWYHLSYKDWILGRLEALWDSLLVRFGIKKSTLIDDLSHQVVMYARLEQTQCLQTYSRAVHYFVFQKSIKIPEIINFWLYQPIRFALLQQIKKFACTPRIQAGALLTTGAKVAGQAVGNVAKAGAKVASQAGAKVASQAGAKVASQAGAKVASQAGAKVASQAGAKVASETGKEIAEQAAFRAIMDGAVVDGAGSIIAKSVGNTVTKLAPDIAGVARALSTPLLNTLDDAASLAANTARATTATQNITRSVVNLVRSVGDDAAVTALPNTAKIAATMAQQAGLKALPNTLAGVVKQAQSLGATVLDDVGVVVSAPIKEVITPMVAALGQTGKAAVVGGELAKQAADALGKMASSQVKTSMLRNLYAYMDDGLKEIFNSLPPAGPLGIRDAWDVLAKVGLISASKTPLTWAGVAKALLLKIIPGTQGFQMGAETLIQIGMTQGSSTAISWVDEADAKISADLQKKQAEIANKFQIKMNEIQASTEAQLQISQQASAWTLGILQAQQAKLTASFSSQQTYLLQSVISDKLATNYVSNPMTWDQYFYCSPMYTPTLNMAEKVNSISSKSSAGTTGARGVSAVTFPKLQQVFYKGSWSVAPSITTKNLANTYIWTAKKGLLTISSLAALTAENLLSKPVINTQFPTLTAQPPSTPINNTWYNIGRIGSWAYSPSDDSFYQYKSVPCTTVQAQAGDPSQAALNSIFTEYIPQTITNTAGQPAYQIQVEAQVNGAITPWLAGIMFNNGRWVSGVTDMMNQYRFCGFYCPSKGAPITFCAAETFYITSSDPEAEHLPPVTPIAQIMATPAELASWKVGKNMVNNPLYPAAGSTNQTALALGQTYVITIYTEPNQIFVSLSLKKSDGSLSPVFGPVLITNRNSIFFTGHGIGFVSAGCSSRFSLQKPQELVFAPADRAAFGQLISSGSKS